MSATHTHFISGKWGIQNSGDIPRSKRRTVHRSRGNIHAIGCPLVLLVSSIFPQVTGAQSHICCVTFLNTFLVRLITMFLGTSYEYSLLFVVYNSCPKFRCQISDSPKTTSYVYVCVCVCVCMCVCVCVCACVCDVCVHVSFYISKSMCPKNIMLDTLITLFCIHVMYAANNTKWSWVCFKLFLVIS